MELLKANGGKVVAQIRSDKQPGEGCKASHTPGSSASIDGDYFHRVPVCMIWVMVHLGCGVNKKANFVLCVHRREDQVYWCGRMGEA